MKIIEVKWEDTTTWEGWHDDLKEIDLDSYKKQKSVGYLVKDEENYIIMAQTVSDAGLADLIQIPRVSITSIRELKELN